MEIKDIYLYKITFEEIPHFYWGIHLVREDDDYMGSSVTFSKLWKIYTPHKQIIYHFEPSTEGWDLARETEKKVIESTWNSSLSLNRNSGGSFSIQQQRDNVSRGMEKHGSNWGVGNPEIREKCYQTQKENGTFGFTKEQEERGRETQKRLKVGYFDPEKQQKGLETQRKLGIGLFDSEKKVKRIQQDSETKTGLYSSENNEKRSQSAKRVNSQVWECLVTGHRSNSGGLSRFQKSRGIDTSKRQRVQ